MQFSLEIIKNKKHEQKNHIQSLIAHYSNRQRQIYAFNPKGRINVIAEVKKASPSHGAINAAADPSTLACTYQQAGASAISVLTDPYYFGGSFTDLKHVADTVALPVLCKEFICYTEQIDAAYLLGADMILLINAMLNEDELAYLYHYTLSKNLIPIIEIHTKSELDRVLPLKPQFIQVNMRNLNSFRIDIQTGIDTLQALPKDITAICASSINNPNDILSIKKQTGAHIFLVGTALMKSHDPKTLLQELINVC